MKKTLSLLVMSTIAVTSVVSTFAATTASPDSAHAGLMMEESYVAWAYQNGLTMYQDMAKFRYNDSISRQEASKMLVKAAENVFGLRYASVDNICNTPYADANKFDKTLAPFIFSACAHNMMHGNDGYFAPHDNILRAEALATIMRAVANMEDTKVNPWYQDYLNKAVTMGLTQLKGSTNDSMIDTNITRGEIVEWLHTLKKNMK